MATNRTVKIHKTLSSERSEDRHSSNSNQSYCINGKLNYRSSNSPISPSNVSARNNVFTGKHAYNDRLNVSNVRNHGKSEPLKSQLEGILSSVSNSSNRCQSASSPSNVTRNFDDSCMQTSPGYEFPYNEDNVYDTSPIAEQQYDDCMSYTSYLSFDNMDNTDMQRDVSASSCSKDTYPIESSRLYENIPPIEEPVYDDVESLGIVQPAVEELLSTESSYVKSLRFLTSSVRSKLEEIPDIDVRSLFSNLDEILLVHESFLRELKQAEHDPEHQLILIGNVFQEFSKDMESVYTVYCSTYTRSTSLLKHYQDIHVAELIKDAIQSLSSGSSSQYTDLSFYLVLPVQRITKYPLILKNILSIDTNTKDTQEALEGALNTMKEVNANINENKRRKEVASKYLRLDQRTLKEKMSTLNTHTLTKKSQRLSLFLKQQSGMVPKREDKEFDNLTDKFHRLAALVSQMEENVVSYVKNVEEYFLIQPETYPLEYLQGSVHPLNGYTIELCNSIYSTFKTKLQIMVLQPLTNLSECLRGPKNLIRKRLDKLLDYENLEERYSETGRMTWEEEDIVNNYKAIHSMLISELPNCILLSYQLLHNIFLSFIAVQKDLAARACFAAEEHASQMQCLTVPEANFRRWVEDHIANSTSLLNEFTKKFDEELPVPVPREHIPAIERQVQQLLKRYSPEKLYQLMSNVKGTREMELTLRRGEVVAVIQCGDTKGNRNRWLVDTGGLRGYVPCSQLQPYQATHSPTLSRSPTHTQSSPVAMKTAVTKKHSAPMCPYPTFLQPQELNAVFQIVAGYSFTARSQYEASITEGEPVIVLEPHDKNGSPEWSLVEVRGQKGYVPSSYLVKIPVKRHSWVT